MRYDRKSQQIIPNQQYLLKQVLLNKLHYIITFLKLMQIDKNYGEYLDEFKIVKTLGSGYSAEVKLGIDQQSNYVAIKQYKHSTSTLETLKDELKVMRALSNENLIKMIDVRENAVNKKQKHTQNCFAIILEYAEGGELFDFIAQTGKFTEKVTRTYFHQIMNGLHYMHDKGYAHRDIKPENLLLTSTFVLKIADFGFSCLIRGKDGTGILKTKLGTEGYMAPEIATKHYDGRKTDIFATGIILFIMYTGNPPFQKPIVTDPYYKLIKEKRYQTFWNAHNRKRMPGYFSQSFKDLVQRMLAYVPNQRPTVLQISKHQWVKGAVSSSAEIQEQFIKRKEKMEAILNQKRKQKQAQKQRRISNIKNQGHNSRGDESAQDKQFMNIYNKQKLFQRKLQKAQKIGLGDLVIKNLECPYAVSLLKQFLQTHKVIICEEETELISNEQNDEWTCVSLRDIENLIEAKYIYKYSVDSEIVESQVKIRMSFAETEDKQLLLHFECEQGNQFYYNKIVRDIKNKCFP